MKQASFSDLGQPTYNVVIYDNRLSSHPRGPSLIRMLLCFGKSRAWASLPFHCAKTVSELDPFHPTNLLFERKQIAQIIVTIRNSRNSIDRLEPISLPCAQRLASHPRPRPKARKCELGVTEASIYSEAATWEDKPAGGLPIRRKAGSLPYFSSSDFRWSISRRK